MDEVKYIVREESSEDIGLLEILSIVRKRWMVFTASLILAGIVCFFLLNRLNDYYEINLKYYSTVAEKEEIGPMVEFLTELTEQHDYAVLASVLNIPIEECQQIRKIKRGEEVTNKNVFVFEIKVETYDPSKTQIFADQISTYFKSAAYLSKRFEIRKAQLELQYETAKRAASDLQNLSNALQKETETAGINSSYPDHVQYDAVNVQTNMASIAESLEMISIAEFFVKPVVPIHPTGPKRSIIFLAAMVVAAFGFCATLVILEKLKT